jgi:delta 1-pyrroline-5-carboxylate dehydrogenase
MKKAAETLTEVVLELGGKDAAVVCNDADLDNVVEFCTRASMQNAGQNCAGLEVCSYSFYIDIRGWLYRVEFMKKLLGG